MGVHSVRQLIRRTDRHTNSQPASQTDSELVTKSVSIRGRERHLLDLCPVSSPVVMHAKEPLDRAAMFTYAWLACLSMSEARG